MEIWRDVSAGYYTPGGDPVWECPNCGFTYCYGIEVINGPYTKCPKCGEDIIYPWMHEYQNKPID